MKNIPEVKLGIVAVSRDCFPIQLSESRRKAVVAACREKDIDIVEIQTTVENEKDVLKALKELETAEVNALVVYLATLVPKALRPCWLRSLAVLPCLLQQPRKARTA